MLALWVETILTLPAVLRTARRWHIVNNKVVLWQMKTRQPIDALELVRIPPAGGNMMMGCLFGRCKGQSGSRSGRFKVLLTFSGGPHQSYLTGMGP